MSGFAAYAARYEATLIHQYTWRLAAGTLVVLAPLFSLAWCSVMCGQRASAVVSCVAVVVGFLLAPSGSTQEVGGHGGHAMAMAAGNLAWVTPFTLTWTAAWLGLVAVVSYSSSTGSTTASSEDDDATAVPSARGAATGDGGVGSSSVGEGKSREGVKDSGIDEDDDVDDDDDDDDDEFKQQDSMPMLRPHRQRSHAKASTRQRFCRRHCRDGSFGRCCRCCLRGFIESSRIGDDEVVRPIVWEGGAAREFFFVVEPADHPDKDNNDNPASRRRGWHPHRRHVPGPCPGSTAVTVGDFRRRRDVWEDTGGGGGGGGGGGAAEVGSVFPEEFV